ncbi:MAG: pilin [Acidobacteriaceae bacterium]
MERDRTGDRASVARAHHRGGESAQPGPPASAGDDPDIPRPARATTKEAATTHPTPTDRTAAASSTSESRHPRAGLHARGAHGRRRPPQHQPPPRHRFQQHRAPGTARRLATVVALTAALLVVLASPAYAAGGGTQTLSGLISNLTTWIVGILAGVATLFLTIGGLRYLTAGGDPGQVEKAKTALKSAAVGYALAVLAPLIVSILASLVHG